MKKVSVIITNRNTEDLLRVCLRNLIEIRNHEHENLELIVVDNNSSDNSVQMVKNEYPDVILVEASDVGRSASGNLGAKEASGDYLLFLSPDAYPRNRTISGMVEYMENHDDVGVSTPKLYLGANSVNKDAHRNFPTPWNSFTKLTGLYKLFPKSKLFNSYFVTGKEANKPYEIDACVFDFILIKKSVFDEVGGFDQDYYAHGEDLDLCYKVRHAGYKTMCLPQFECGHLKTKVSGKEGISLSEKINFTRSSTKAMRLFMEKNYKSRYPLPLIWLMQGATYLLELSRVIGTVVKHIFS